MLRRRMFGLGPCPPAIIEYIRSTTDDEDGFQPGGRTGRNLSRIPGLFARIPMRTPYDMKDSPSAQTRRSIFSIQVDLNLSRGSLDAVTHGLLSVSPQTLFIMPAQS